MTQRIAAQGFHPMRGHVEDGAEVLFEDGTILTVKAASVAGGWNLVTADGLVVAAADGAFDLTARVVELSKDFA